MSKYLVTGAAGFIGSAIAKKLLARGDEVWTIDNLSTGYQKNIPDGVVFIEGGCQEEASVNQLKGVKLDAILHIAGQSSGEISFDDPVNDLQTNTESTLRLIKLGLEMGCHRFIYASSMSVYGDVPQEAIAEEFTPNPLSFYGVGKLASEHYLRIYASKGLKATSLRYFNVYGPGQNMSNLRQGMVSIYLAQFIKNENVLVKGALDRFRDFIYIDDVVNFTTNIIGDEKSFGGIYNVASGVKTTVESLLSLIKEISAIDKKIITEGSTAGDQKGIFADMSLVQETFDFKVQYDLGQGLSKMIEWARSFQW